MIELRRDTLVFSFPEVHEDAVLRISFQRTLRIPDDGRSYPLPPGLGKFPVRHVDDFYHRIPESWRRRGGVMLPMYQSEAMWLRFSAPNDYPFAVKVAAGKINAVTGESWTDGIHRDPQDYMVAPEQPWLDGFAVEKGVIRQFVAMPLGAGYSAEEQLTGKAKHGGIQIVAYPMKREAYERLLRERRNRLMDLEFAVADLAVDRLVVREEFALAPGGRMRQEIYEDPHDFADWDLRHRSRCFVHLCNAVQWREITGEAPPTEPMTARDYTRVGLPWFEYYAADLKALEGGKALAGLESIAQLGEKKGAIPLPDNDPVDPVNVIGLGPGRPTDQVREGAF